MVGLPIGIGAGLTGFIGIPENRVLGVSWYVGVSVSLDLLPLADIDVASAYYFPINQNPPKSYINPETDQVDVGLLVSDIENGDHSPWLVGTIPVYSSVSRKTIGVTLARKYTRIYNEIHRKTQ